MSLAVSINMDLKVGVVVRPIDSSAADRVLTEIRTSSGNYMIDKSEGKEEISRLLREGGVMGILLDQNASWYEGVESDIANGKDKQYGPLHHVYRLSSEKRSNDEILCPG